MRYAALSDRHCLGGLYEFKQKAAEFDESEFLRHAHAVRTAAHFQLAAYPFVKRYALFQVFRIYGYVSQTFVIFFHTRLLHSY